MQRKTLAVLAAISAGTLLAGCGGGGPSGSSGSKLSDGKVVLGVLTDLSGVYSQIAGQKTVAAVQMAVDDYKKKYGSKAVAKDISVVSADHQDKPDVANSQARQMYERQNVDAIFDVPTSSAALAVANVAKSDKRMYFNIGAATTALTGKECNKYSYGWAYDTYMLANGTARTVTENGGKNWYLIYPDYAFGQDMQAKFTSAIQSSGGKVVANDPTPFPNDNFSTFMLKAPTLNPQPQVLGAMQAGGDLVNVAKQYQQFKLKDKGIKLAIGLMFDNDIKSIGVDTLAGTQFTTAWFWSLDARSKAWADEFKQRTGERPNFDQAANYSAATQYLEAIQRAGTDSSDSVVKQLDGMKFDDVFARNAKVRSQDHRVVHDAYLVEVKSKADQSEPEDFTKLVKDIPADQAFAPASSDCHLG
ncbi:ABC transporter substrate-binding protein [Oryzihumus sp.]|uniref:ABC transporter substrate-binding protein n=1 Tax=Oryzihumus sp. TaxID=1968903 RepID=UPI002ED8D0F0